MQFIWEFDAVLIFLEAIHLDEVVLLNSDIAFIHISLLFKWKVILVCNKLLHLLEDVVKKLLPSHPCGKVDDERYIDQLHRVG